MITLERKLTLATVNEISIDEYMPGDLESIFAYRSDPRINQFYSINPKTVADLGDYLKRNIVTFNVASGYSLFVIRKNKTIIGDVGINCWGYHNKICAIGYALKPEYQRKGYAFSSLRIFIDTLFVKYEKNRIQATFDPKNEPSMKLLEKLGFTKEGYLREVEFENSKWKDEILYALLNSEWNNTNK
jgi:RimJ/RimL family protein N-acetyltransferase